MTTENTEQIARTFLTHKYGADFKYNSGSVIKGANFWSGFAKDLAEFANSEKEQTEKKYQELSEKHNQLLKSVKLLEASIAGALDGLELDNMDDSVGKSIIIEMFKKQQEIINSNKKKQITYTKKNSN